MKKAAQTPAAVDKPPVYRTAPGKPLGGIASEIAMKRSLAIARLRAERNVVKAAAWRPVTDLLHKDPSATEAAKRVIRIDQQIADLLSGQPPLGFATPPVSVRPGDTIFSPPYDHSYHGSHGLFVAWPYSSDPHDTYAHVTDGTFEVDAIVDPDYDGVFDAIVGLALDLATSKPGSLELRPLVPATTWWYTATNGLSSYVEGDITLTVLDSTTGTPVISPAAAAPTPNAGAAAGQVASGHAAVASFTLFSQPGEDGASHRDTPTVTGDQLSLTVDVEPGMTYQVWVHLYITGNQSGPYAFASSYAQGYIQATFPLMLARLHA